jgi:hypothetical protein
MKFARLALFLSVFVSATLLAQSHPLPLLYEALTPASIPPGHGAFTLTVNGTHFVAGAVVHWSGSARKTTYVSQAQVRAAITAADVARAGTASITVVNPAPGGGTSNPILFPVRTAGSTVAFTPDGSVTIAGAVAAGDFNRDGNTGLAVGLNTDEVKIFAGKGNGLFAAPISSSTPLSPANYLLAADFNNDGKLDLAVASSSGGFTGGSIFLGNGAGAIAAAPGNHGFQGTPLAVADFKGDGKLDLLTSFTDTLDSANSIFIYFGDGKGGFASNSIPVAPSFVVSTGPTIGDFNRDGILDFALPGIAGSLGNLQNVMQVYLGNGDGTFRPPVNSPASQDFGAVAVADINHDGKLDLVADGTCVFLGKGDGTFTEKGCLKLPAGVFIIASAFGDFNGDGKLDLVSLGSFENTPPFNQIVLLSLGNGDGTFRAPLQFRVGVFPVLPTFGGFAVADFNDDGKLDLAVSSQNRTFVLLQK